MPYAEMGASLSTIAVLVYYCKIIFVFIVCSNFVVFEIL